jgi:hypothetical protein
LLLGWLPCSQSLRQLQEARHQSAHDRAHIHPPYNCRNRR